MADGHTTPHNAAKTTDPPRPWFHKRKLSPQALKKMLAALSEYDKRHP